MLAAVAALSVAAPAAAGDKPEKYRYELTEFAGSSQISTAHEIYPCSPNIDVVSDGTLSGSFSSPLNRVVGVKLGRSDARGKIVADAAGATYQQGGTRDGDYTPCGADESESFVLPCARSVPTVPGIVGRFVDATKKKVEVDWSPAFDGVEARYTPDFFCIPKMGNIPMATEGNFLGGCKEHRYPRRIFTGDDAFELEVICSTDYIPFQNSAGIGTYAGTYRAQLTLEAVADQ